MLDEPVSQLAAIAMVPQVLTTGIAPAITPPFLCWRAASVRMRMLRCWHLGRLKLIMVERGALAAVLSRTSWDVQRAPCIETEEKS
mmetsp:Transcript_51688/g.103603  ORF Transcript_51688/g.103603 Transcript_51688/m.103603 type:complete len:86 (+) Transcript_51688:109-366(+)